MVKRLNVTLEQKEYSGLLELAEGELRNPADQLRFLLRQKLIEELLISEEDSPFPKNTSARKNFHAEKESTS